MDLYPALRRILLNRCLKLENCELFQHPGGRLGICTLIQKTSDGNGGVTVTAENNGFIEIGEIFFKCFLIHCINMNA